MPTHLPREVAATVLSPTAHEKLVPLLTANNEYQTFTFATLTGYKWYLVVL